MRTNSTTFGSNIQYKFFAALLSVLLFACGVQAETIGTKPVELDLEGKPEVVFKGGVLQGGVAVANDLPQEFYGSWTVLSVRAETNNPEEFLLKSSDIWSFSRHNDIITLTNPINGASASITVEEVAGTTAIFTRRKKDDEYFEVETAEITVEGDSFYGTDTIIIKHFKNGIRIKTDIVKYNVRGLKISGPTLKDIFAQ